MKKTYYKRRRAVYKKRSYRKKRSYPKRTYKKRSYKKRSYRKKGSSLQRKSIGRWTQGPTNRIATKQVMLGKGKMRVMGYTAPINKSVYVNEDPSCAQGQFVLQGSHVAVAQQPYAPGGGSNYNESTTGSTFASSYLTLVNPGNTGAQIAVDGWTSGLDMLDSVGRHPYKTTTYGSAVTLRISIPSNNSNPGEAVASSLITNPVKPNEYPSKVTVALFPTKEFVVDIATSPGYQCNTTSDGHWTMSDLRRQYGVKFIQVPTDGKTHTIKHYCSCRTINGTPAALDDVYYGALTSLNYESSQLAMSWVCVILNESFPGVVRTVSGVDVPYSYLPSVNVDISMTYYWKWWNMGDGRGDPLLEERRANHIAKQHVAEEEDDEEEAELDITGLSPSMNQKASPSVVPSQGQVPDVGFQRAQDQVRELQRQVAELMKSRPQQNDRPPVGQYGNGGSIGTTRVRGSSLRERIAKAALMKSQPPPSQLPAQSHPSSPQRMDTHP
jgi:hypothetical protein